MSAHVWPTLFETVKASFQADGITAEQAFGFRTPMAQPKTGQGMRAKISWVPGDDSGSSDAGKQVPTQNPGQVPTRSLGTFQSAFTIYLEACEAASKDLRESEVAQYSAVWSLFECWWKAFYYAAYQTPNARVGGRIALQKASWITDKRVAVRGMALRLLITIPVQLPDDPVTMIPDDAVGVLTGSLTDDIDEDGTDPETQRTDDP